MKIALCKKQPKKPAKSLDDSVYWKRFANKRGGLSAATPSAWPMGSLVPEYEDEPEKEEQEVQIELTSTFSQVTSEVRYNYVSRAFEQVVERDSLLSLLELPSKVLRKDEARGGVARLCRPTSPESVDSDLDEVVDNSRRAMEELYGGTVSKEELARIDAQPNPFNFSDRVSLTTKIPMKPKPRHPEPLDLPGLPRVAKVLERMVAQNIYDDIAQDFKFWEDASDEYHPLEGSLLPLWKFKYEHSKSLLVSDICWSPVYADLFAISYLSSGVDGGGEEMGGMLCLYTLKSPSTPERVFRTPFGVVTARFHPQHGSMLVAGRTDGSVVVYDVTAPQHAAAICSSAVKGKHLMQVTQVRWVRTQPGEELSFFSVSLDGRVTQWHLHSACLVHRDVLDFASCRQPTKPHSSSDKVVLEGAATCIDFRPDHENIMLLGTDTGAVFQCSVASTTHTLFRYPAHTSPVRQVSWNSHHHGIFVTCSLDWMVKVWQYDSPLIQLDLGGAVAGVTWTPHSSSVFVAVTDEGRVHVYDLHVRKCHPLCVQGVVQKKRGVVTCIAFSPFHPVILVGGDRYFCKVVTIASKEYGMLWLYG
ncbi:dynein intermediate chain 2, ciliary-like [Penaeus indicus]|uniref:dynein intermediate chain 2, ciliary-like n=1 Tax=Penaeus indicus TaxID=29960 RepID=UPI00300DBDBC